MRRQRRLEYRASAPTLAFDTDKVSFSGTREQPPSCCFYASDRDGIVRSLELPANWVAYIQDANGRVLWRNPTLPESEPSDSRRLYKALRVKCTDDTIYISTQGDRHSFGYMRDGNLRPSWHPNTSIFKAILNEEGIAVWPE